MRSPEKRKMNEGGDNDCLIWENNQGWPFFNSNNLVGNGDKLPDPIRSDTCQPQTATKAMGEANTVNRKRSASGRNNDGNGCGGGGEGESDHEIHIWTERERRKKMRNMFSNIHVLLPQLPPKADKSTIVDEAVNYIKTLEKTLQKLQKKKLERLHPIGSTMNSYDHISIITSPSQKLPSVGCSREQFLADQGSTSNSAAITPTNYNKTASLLLNNVPATFQTWSSPHVILNVCGEEAHISVCCPKKVGLFSSTCHVLEKHKIEILSAQISSDHYRSMFMIQAHASGGSSLGQFSEQFTVEEIYQQAAAEIMLWTTFK